MIATRYSNTFCLQLPERVDTGLLIQIHPIKIMDSPIPLGVSKVSIGRDSSQSVVLLDDSVSRQHAEIEWSSGSFRVRDLKSTNGTFVNEVRCHDEALKPGDSIRFGNQIFKFLSSEEVESQYHETVFRMMTTDGLTQVYNKRFFIETLERELQQSNRSNQSLCVLMLDLDHFKSVNDIYGHLAGDAVLVEFATRAQSVLRCGELLARYGGEEFAMLCAPATTGDAANAAERVRAIVAATPVQFETKEIPITVSIGVAQREPKSKFSPNDLIALADKYLYQAKKNGRNRVEYKSLSS